LTELVHTISHRVAGYLVREGILERDEEQDEVVHVLRAFFYPESKS
jgi:hypothetical protein